METTRGGPTSEASVDQALGLLASVTPATVLLVETGATQTRWGVTDPGGHLPVVKTTLVVRDAQADGQFGGHPVIQKLGVASLVGTPLQGSPSRPVMGTLWALSPERDAFDERALEAFQRAGALLGSLLAPSMALSQLEQLALALPVPAVARIGDRLVSNAATCALTGFSGDEVATVDTWHNALFRDDGPMVRELYELDRQHGFLDSRTAQVTRKDGWERMVQSHATAVGDEGELWLLTDITERVASQERFRLLFEQSSTPHLLVDATGVIDCNPAAVALLGYRSKSDLLRLKTRQYSPELQSDGRRSEEKAAEMESLAFEQGSHRFDWVVRTTGGLDVPVEVTLTPQSFGAQRVLLVEWHDLTERVRYEEGLRKARDSAMHYARAKSEFLAVMSHEIRTPMNGVIGMTRLLLDTPLSHQQRDYVDSLRACGEGLLTLLNDILDFSRLEAGKVTLEHIPTSLRDLIDEAVSVVSDAAEAKDLSVVVVADASAPDRVYADPTRLRQVLLNLLSNAVKFTEKGGVEVRLLSGGTAEDGKRVITLAVKDSGIGIAPEALPRLFASFSQEDSSTTRRFGGSGLGLAICKRLVGLMEGVIDVTTGPQGTTFSVHLTFDEASAPSERQVLKGRRVMIVAPVSLTRLGVVQVISSAGAEVTVVDSELQAFAKAEHADAVIVDDEVTGPSARAMAARLVAPHRKVGVLTSKRTAAAEFPPGCFRITRPIRRRALIDAMVRALVTTAPASPNTAGTETAPFLDVRVLVAEDNAINQRVIRGLLGKLGCRVQVAENGAEALAALDEKPFDLVFMDCQMPVLDGFEATKQLRERHGAGVPVVALTAGTMEGDRERCLAAGMDDFLAKPVRPEELTRVLERFARRPAAIASVG